MKHTRSVASAIGTIARVMNSVADDDTADHLAKVIKDLEQDMEHAEVTDAEDAVVKAVLAHRHLERISAAVLTAEQVRAEALQAQCLLGKALRELTRHAAAGGALAASYLPCGAESV